MKPQMVTALNLEELRQNHSELKIVDNVDLAISELFDIKFPGKKDFKSPEEVSTFSKELTLDDSHNWGQWVYYPWLNTVVHFPPKKDFRALRTSRNRNLISESEQSKLYEATILIIGMSVGSNVVEALVGSGIGQKLVLVDMDIIEPTNLNRIRSPYHHIGLHKVDSISRRAWEIDPYLEIIQEEDGLNDENIKQLIADHNVNVIVDEMDDLRMKVILRETAKQAGLPVVMAADDGDGVLLDIERYDLDTELPLFGGQIPVEIIEKIKKGNLSRPELGSMIGKYFVGIDNIPLRMFESLAQVGKTLPSWPQLGGAATMAGVTLAYSIRKILLNQDIKPGRTLISLEEKLDPEVQSPAYQGKLNSMRKLMAEG